jgi:hypothetical protein
MYYTAIKMVLLFEKVWYVCNYQKEKTKAAVNTIVTAKLIMLVMVAFLGYLYL